MVRIKGCSQGILLYFN